MALAQAPLAPATTDWSAFPGDDAVSVGGENVHDPTIVEVGGKYFCFCTGNGPFGLVRSSSDLRSWRLEGNVLSTFPAWLTERYPHRSVWAPDILVLGHTLRMYYCMSNWGTNKSVIGLAQCDLFDPAHPTAGWRDLGLVMESRPEHETYNCIDPETIVDEQGRQWMFFGSYFAGIFVAQLDPATGKLLHPDDPQPVLVARNTSEKGDPLEGAAVCRRDGNYYLFVSYGLAGQGVRSTYRVMVGRSKSVTGPFVDRDGVTMADGGHTNVLKSSPPMFSPGHCDVLKDSSGRWLMPYHFYDGRKHWHGDVWGRPVLQVRELLWDEQGWPLPGLPVEFDDSRAPGGNPAAGTWAHQADFGDVGDIRLMPDGSVRGGTMPGRWHQNGDSLTIDWSPQEAGSQTWTDHLMLAYGGRYYVGRNQSGAVIRGAKIEGP